MNAMRSIIAAVIVMAAVTVVLTFFPAGTTGLIGALTGTFTLATVLALSALAALLIYLMATGTIDLRYLIAGDDGTASLSRFQMLLFTFVIAALYFLYALYTLLSAKTGQPASICPPTAPDLLKAIGGLNETIKAAAADANKLGDATNAMKAATSALLAACSNSYTLPDIPNSVLGLLGISGGSYLLSKGIQAASNPAPATTGGTTGATGNATGNGGAGAASVRRNIH
jgi:hypothetical protein